jgi:hypothetical protein
MRSSAAICIALVTFGHVVEATAATVTNVSVTPRGGQIFVTWDEAETPPGTTFNVYAARAAITDVKKAEKVGHHLEQHSARDWWADPASFSAKDPPGKPVGWIVEGGKTRLDPRGGLFVFTVPENGAGDYFFGVTTTDAKGQEATDLIAGANATAAAAKGEPGPIEAFWQAAGPEPACGAGRGKPLWMKLHGKSGVIAGMEYLAFGDERMGWRAGLPFKFAVRIIDDTVVIQPTDRTWINRPHRGASENAPAIWSFWYGYNSHIYDPALMSTGVPTNYTERRLSWILDFVARRYEPDANRWYLSGSSMGGCGTISFGYRNADRFAALHANVPIVSYSYLEGASASRLEETCSNGAIPPTLLTNEGVPLLDRMNGTRFVTEAKNDLPYLFFTQGRRDGSIPWANNPPFYRALDDARQGFSVYWNDGTHPEVAKRLPDDVQDWMNRFRRFRRDESFPAFSNTSTNRNPGDGRPDDGDILGWMNRGLDWSDIRDEADSYSITLRATTQAAYPVQTDVTLRRLQQFPPKPGDVLRARIGEDEPRSITVDERGLITVRGVRLSSPEPVTLRLKR